MFQWGLTDTLATLRHDFVRQTTIFHDFLRGGGVQAPQLRAKFALSDGRGGFGLPITHGKTIPLYQQFA
jgi:hypothetical protein